MHTIGIDLGTTRSRVALLDERGRPERMENAEGELITPSVVYFGDGEVIVGDKAVAAAQRHPERMVRYAKRWLGDPTKTWEFDGAVYSPVDVSALILRKLKHDVERARGPVGRAVIGVPAHFDAQCRQLTLEAARQAGITRADLVNEPVASALMFVLGEAIGYEELADDQTLVVYDLGGGTFDLSLVEYQKSSIRVLASTGDLKLGGIDWNERLIEQLAGRFSRVHGTAFRSDKRFLLGLAQHAENAKRVLSGQTTTTVGVNYRGRKQSVVVTRDEFEEWTRDLVERTELVTRQMLADVGTRMEQVDNLLVVGGATRMPMIRELIKKMRKSFLESWANPDYDPSRKLNPEFAVAQGAALYGGILNGNSGPRSGEVGNSRLAGFVTTAVNSRSLGVLVRNDAGELVNQIVIPRNTPLPVAQNFRVSTIRPNQERIRLRIVESEERTGSTDQDVVCVCTISNLPASLPEGSVFDVSLFYAANGLLHVLAKHNDSGLLSTASVQRECTSKTTTALDLPYVYRGVD